MPFKVHRPNTNMKFECGDLRALDMFSVENGCMRSIRWQTSHFVSNQHTVRPTTNKKCMWQVPYATCTLHRLHIKILEGERANKQRKTLTQPSKDEISLCRVPFTSRETRYDENGYISVMILMKINNIFIMFKRRLKRIMKKKRFCRMVLSYVWLSNEPSARFSNPFV